MRPADAEAALRAGRQARRTVAPFTDADPTLDEQWGYDVQALDRAQRTAPGESVVGAELGLTSAAKQQRMAVHQPIVGFLTETMRVETDSLAQAATTWAQPRIEPEIAFLTARPLSAPLTLAEAVDNTSAAGFLVGPITRPAGLDDLAQVHGEIEVDGDVVHRATGAAILGHPLRAIVWLSEQLGRHGQTLPEGSLVLAGALTDAVPLVAGSRYTIRMDRLGTLSAVA